MDLSIIVVSWNTRDLLAQCLDAIFAYPPRCEIEVWVVDNGSKDGSAEMVRKQFPQVRLIENPENAGFARANNQAIQKSDGKYVLLVNSDATVKPNALSSMVSFLDQHHDGGIAGGKLEGSEGAFQSSFNDFPSLFSQFLILSGMAQRFFGPYFPSHGPKDSQQAREVDWVGGAFLIARREAIDEAGLLDEDYFMYGEEMDWCYRMWRNGWKVYFVPDACAIHLGGQSSKAAGFEKLLWLTRSHLLFVRKYRGAFIAWTMAAFATFASFVKAIIWFGLGCMRNSSRSLAWSKARANWRVACSPLL